MKKVLFILLSTAVLSTCSTKTSTTGNTAVSKAQVTVEGTIVSSQASKTEESKLDQTREQSSNQGKPAQVETSQASTGDSTVVANPPMDEETANRLRIAEPAVQAGQKVVLGVPQQYQEAWNWCAPTAVSMILSYKGINVSQAQLAKEMGTDENFGTHNANAIQVLNRYLFSYDQPSAGQAGYRLATVTTASNQSEDMRLFKERLTQNIRDGYPIYMTIDNAKMYPGKSGEHNVTVIGYQLTQDGSDIAYVYYLDPSYAVKDPTYGGLKKVTPEELLGAMLTCIEPNYGW